MSASMQDLLRIYLIKRIIQGVRVLAGLKGLNWNTRDGEGISVMDIAKMKNCQKIFAFLEGGMRTVNQAIRPREKDALYCDQDQDHR